MGRHRLRRLRGKLRDRGRLVHAGCAGEGRERVQGRSPRDPDHLARYSADQHLQRDPHGPVRDRLAAAGPPRGGSDPGARHSLGTRPVRVAQPRPHRGWTSRSRLAVTPDGNVDYLHLNSIGVDSDGHLPVSARHTSAVYKVHRRTGKVIWRLGGKRSDFALGPGVSFGYQHDARRHSDGTLTIFDNAASLATQQGIVSRPLRLRLDTAAKVASLARDYPSPDPRTAWAMGNAQQVDDGGLFVGWGTFPGFSEIGPDGVVRFDARFASGSVSYRAHRHAWVGQAGHPPHGRGGTGGQRIDSGVRELERRHRGRPLAGARGCEPGRPETGSDVLGGVLRRRSHSAAHRASSPSLRSTGADAARRVAARAGLIRARARFGMTLRRWGVMRECDARTREPRYETYRGDRGRSSAPRSTFRRHKASF